LGINTGGKRSSGNWPWSALGISETTDKAAIHAAYDAKRAELDAEAMRISAFAKLTEAREKALFLASELLRVQEREGGSADAASTVADVRRGSQFQMIHSVSGCSVKQVTSFLRG